MFWQAQGAGLTSPWGKRVDHLGAGGWAEGLKIAVSQGEDRKSAALRLRPVAGLSQPRGGAGNCIEGQDS